jgi:hypothetical protein
LLIAAACLAWGIDNNLTRKPAADPVVIALIKGVVAGSVNLIVALLLERACHRSARRARRWSPDSAAWA